MVLGSCVGTPAFKKITKGAVRVRQCDRSYSPLPNVSQRKDLWSIQHVSSGYRAEQDWVSLSSLQRHREAFQKPSWGCF